MAQFVTGFEIDETGVGGMTVVYDDDGDEVFRVNQGFLNRNQIIFALNLANEAFRKGLIVGKQQKSAEVLAALDLNGGKP